MARKRKGRLLNGVLLLDKATGHSSNDMLQKVKRLYGAQKAGHTGALDPLATGMLPICLGEATKFSQYLLESDKRYRVIAKLGERTDTSDSDGEVVQTREIDFTNEQNQDLKLAIINFTKTNDLLDNNKSKIGDKYKALINDIDKDINLKKILSKKNDAEIEEALSDLITEVKEMNQLKQIEFLEKKVAKNLDEASYSELIKLKSQLNRQ